MLIHEVSRLTGLTKKAIEYYTLCGLVSPAAAENGYRQYSEEDAAVLRKVGVLRRLDVGIADIKAILDDKTCSALQNVLVKKELDLQYGTMKRAALEHLCAGKPYSEIGAVLQSLILLTYLLASVKTAIGPYPMQGQVRAFYHFQIRR